MAASEGKGIFDPLLVESYDRGYLDGWNDCIKQALVFLNDPSFTKAEIAAGMKFAVEMNEPGREAL